MLSNTHLNYLPQIGVRAFKLNRQSNSMPHRKLQGDFYAQSRKYMFQGWKRGWMANFYIARSDINLPPGLLTTYIAVHIFI